MKITNGIAVFDVTRGAFEMIYKKQGFTPFCEEAEEVVVEVVSEAEANTDSIETKPISQWSNKELRKYAASLGMNPNDKDLRSTIKNELDKRSSE